MWNFQKLHFNAGHLVLLNNHLERSKLCQIFWKLSLVYAIYEQSCYFLSWGPKNLKERALQFIIFCLLNVNCCFEPCASMNCQMQNAAPIIRIKLTFFSIPILCKFWVWPIVIFSPRWLRPSQFWMLCYEPPTGVLTHNKKVFDSAMFLTFCSKFNVCIVRD